MLAIDAAGELPEQGFLYLDELSGVDDVEHFFDLIKEHNLFGAVDLGPVTQEAAENFLCETRVLFEELDDTVGELRMIERERFDLVQRDEYTGKKHLVLLLERQSEAVDNRSKNFQELGDAVVTFGLVDKLEKDIVDGSADKSA